MKNIKGYLFHVCSLIPKKNVPLCFADSPFIEHLLHDFTDGLKIVAPWKVTDA
jgi:hypothetical protein